MVIVERPMNSNDPQRCPFDTFLMGNAEAENNKNDRCVKIRPFITMVQN